MKRLFAFSTTTVPCSGARPGYRFPGIQEHTQKTPHLDELTQKDLFGVRRGVLKFRGYAIRKNHRPSNPPTDADFEPKFQPKGVDTRIG